MTDWTDRARRVLEGEALGREESLAILKIPDEDLDDLLQGAFLLRSNFYGRRVRLHVLLNAKSGACPEDCAFCSQSARAGAPVETHPILPREEMVEAARRAKAVGAWRFCISTATRGPTDGQLDVLCEAVREIREEVGLRVCASLGFMEKEQIERLVAAGVDRVNHNLETGERHFPEICTTHDYRDRVETVHRVKEAGAEVCCGGIVGQGESLEDVVDLAFALRDLGAESIPINFLDPRPGTPMEGQPLQDPKFCLKVLAMFRFVHPSRDIRVAGGREVNLGELQPLALNAVSSIFTDGYLTTPGNRHAEDIRMVREAGYEIEPAL